MVAEFIAFFMMIDRLFREPCIEAAKELEDIDIGILGSVRLVKDDTAIKPHIDCKSSFMPFGPGSDSCTFCILRLRTSLQDAGVISKVFILDRLEVANHYDKQYLRNPLHDRNGIDTSWLRCYFRRRRF